MVIYARYMYSGSVASTFLKICECFDGTANTTESSLQVFMTDKGLPVSKMVGLGTDGASVMVGRHSRVAARFKQCQPLLNSIHCICHRLALAAAQAGNNIVYYICDIQTNPFPIVSLLSQQLGENIWATSNREAS